MASKSLTQFATWLVLALFAATRAQAGLSLEYETKAAYLFKFISYVDWPDQSAGTITIGVVGDNPFGEALAPLNGRKVNGRTVVVREVASAAEWRNCQIVFISPSEKQRCGQIIESLKGSRTLTVSEIDGFAERGGIINFIAERNKVRFEINNAAARSKGLTISAELLKLAKIVGS
jgi:YfiR/HmsC-like